MQPGGVEGDVTSYRMCDRCGASVGRFAAPMRQMYALGVTRGGAAADGRYCEGCVSHLEAITKLYEAPESVISSLDVVGRYAIANAIDRAPFVQLDDDGEVWFNNEYEINPDDAVKIAIMLLGYAKRKGALEP